MNAPKSAPHVDFSRLTLCDALDLALFVEEEARDRYEEFAEQLAVHHTPAAAEFFRKMARIEDKHRKALETRRRELFGKAPVRVARTQIFDVEAPEYGEARVFMSVHQALEVALQSEVKAHGFFVAALESVRDPQVRALFEELREDEVKHQELVRAEIERAAPEDPGNPGDFCDDPAPL